MRRTLEVTISGDANNRDAGKRFKITEMSAADAEDWGMRALGAMARGDTKIDSAVLSMGMAGFSLLGLRSFISAPIEEARPLMAEMMECVERIEEKVTRRLVDTDTEEVSTRLFLRDEVLKLHANFSVLENLSTGLRQLRQVMSAVDSSITKMSPDESPQSSQEA